MFRLAERNEPERIALRILSEKQKSETFRRWRLTESRVPFMIAKRSEAVRNMR